MCMFCVENTKENLLRKKVVKKLRDRLEKEFPNKPNKIWENHTKIAVLSDNVYPGGGTFYCKEIDNFDQKLDKLQQIEDRIIEELTQIFKK